MEDSQIKEILKRIFLETFQDLDKDNFNFNKKQEEFNNWDSFSTMGLISKVENSFNIRFELDEIVGLDSPQHFFEIIKQKLK